MINQHPLMLLPRTRNNISPEELLDGLVLPTGPRYRRALDPATNCGLATDEVYSTSDWNMCQFEEALKCAQFHAIRQLSWNAVGAYVTFVFFIRLG